MNSQVCLHFSNDKQELKQSRDGFPFLKKTTSDQTGKDLKGRPQCWQKYGDVGILPYCRWECKWYNHVPCRDKKKEVNLASLFWIFTLLILFPYIIHSLETLK